jgi:heat shock factor-binding protein 1
MNSQHTPPSFTGKQQGLNAHSQMDQGTINTAVTAASSGSATSSRLNPTSPQSLSHPHSQLFQTPSPESKTLEADEQDQDLNIFVTDLLDQMTNKFEHMGNSILHRIDTMGDRIDNLEKSIGDLMASQNVDGLQQGPGTGVATGDASHNSTSQKGTAEF